MIISELFLLSDQKPSSKVSFSKSFIVVFLFSKSKRPPNTISFFFHF
ncbi:hypothetical protein FUSPEROL_02444 [Fusobacterium periodonticum ATCC 33693]|uniref:Uncharacterized protein n=1 Tax=Fusobacterium periodonticum ATCC 33693 TaxID=546275 RepID=D4CYD0_9FUSO|nr:hypothetical protein FUSPEROL_02444 [Fusobacterium periodonticum ATCC 33693]